MTEPIFSRHLTAWLIHVRRQIFLDMTGGIVIGRLLRSPIVTGSLLGWVSRIAQMAFQVLSVRMVISTLGTDAYAGVVLISGLLGWVGSVEFGFSYGLMNTVSVRKAKGENDGGLRLFAIFCYVGFSLLGILLSFLVSPFLADRFLAAVPYTNRIELLGISCAILVMVSTANIGNRLLFADQKVFLYYVLSLASTALSLIAILLLYLGILPGRIDVVIAAMFVPQALVGLASLALSVKGLKFALPDPEELKETALVSLKFLLLNFLTLITVQTDTFVISQLLSAREIATYGIYTKLFTAMNLLVTTPLSILWPRFSAHAARGERTPMRKLLTSYLLVSMSIMAAFGIFIYLFGGWIVGILAPHQNIIPPPYFVLCLTLLQLSILWTGGFHTAGLSMSVLTPALILTPIQAVISLASAWILARHFGLIGVTGGILLSYLVLAVWVSPLIVRMAVRRYVVAPQPKA